MSSVTQMTLTSMWLEVLAYGVNSVLFSICVFVLLGRQAEERLKYSSRLLLFASTFLFTTATVHMTLSFLQLLKAFTDSAIISKPRGTDVYLASNSLLVTNDILYVINVFAQDLLLIWKLHVVLNHRWRVCILPLFLLIANVVCASVGIYHLSRAPAAGLDDSYLSRLVKIFTLSGWALGFSLNAGLTCSIAYYLWRVGKGKNYVGRSDYKSAIRLVVESGALMTSSVQVNTATPLLIVVRVGMVHYRNSDMPTASDHTQSTVAIDVHIDVMQPTDPLTAYPRALAGVAS
ncbi:hypothetical protein SERLA73DRAFT_77872 [Serpula lacrymans var. lacrymans S7.3]|uniref:Uncharacterized protein n=1 Tax=Serpula lacrymans var. lacrymans (strain S7.3) TaxID=936435 RepID=F8QB97_SERL3|nr:hypothetical protein SERLA73DRAFT_77872 [Serpula lacrymans var. lacrymans S7.3]